MLAEDLHHIAEGFVESCNLKCGNQYFAGFQPNIGLFQSYFHNNMHF